MYQELADIACERITAAITRAEIGSRPVKAVLDSYNPSRLHRPRQLHHLQDQPLQDGSPPCHINWVVLDSNWEGEFCRVVESHPRVKAYVKNHNLGFEVPYRYASEMRTYTPDFIVVVNGGHDLLHLVVEIKGYRREDAKDKKATMENYWVPGVNYHGRYGRWAFAEFTDIYAMESDFEARVGGRVRQDGRRCGDRSGQVRGLAWRLGGQSGRRWRLTHDEASRTNIPTAEYQTVMEEDDRSPIQVAYERRNRDLDPQLVWRGKDGQDWSDLVVQAPRSSSRRRFTPRCLIDDLLREAERLRREAVSEGGFQADLFSDFNGLPNEAARPSSISTMQTGRIG